MNRIRELESIRGAWSVLILVFHATQAPFFSGWSRVDLFFVLSGYFATRRLVEPGRRPSGLIDDLARRSLRLLPEYYLLLLLAAALGGSPAYPDRPPHWLAAVTLTQNVPLYWSGSPWTFCHRYLAHTWILGVELQFFVLFSVLYRLMGTAILAPLALGLLTSSVLLRGGGLHPWVLLGRGDGLALGMLLALILAAPGRAGRPSTWLGLYLVALIGLGYLGWFLGGSEPVPHAFDRPLDMRESLAVLASNFCYAGSVGLIVCHANHPILGFLRVGWLRRLGGLSYGIYLYSFAAIALATALLDGLTGIGRGWTAPLALALAIGAAAASRAAIERPLRIRLGRRQGTTGDGLPSLGDGGGCQPAG